MRMAIWESPIRIWAVRHKKKRQKNVHFNQTDGADRSSLSRTLKAEYTFSSISNEIDHIRGYKTQLEKFNAIVITQSMLIDDNGVKLEIRKITEN